MIAAEYVCHSGSDLLVANALRRSFGVGYETWSEERRTARGRSDRQLVEDCATDRHLLPFRHPHVTLSCTAPLPVARQLGKHQVGMTWSEISRRYVGRSLTFHEIEDWRAAPEDRRQGSGPSLPAERNVRLKALQSCFISAALGAYKDALALGASQEQARFLLPQSMDVLWTWTGSLLAWATVVKRRRHPDAQAETRKFVEIAAAIMEPLFPACWPALMEVEL